MEQFGVYPEHFLPLDAIEFDAGPFFFDHQSVVGLEHFFHNFVGVLYLRHGPFIGTCGIY